MVRNWTKKTVLLAGLTGTAMLLLAQAPASLPPDVQLHLDAEKKLEAQGLPSSTAGEYSNVPRNNKIPGTELFPPSVNPNGPDGKPRVLQPTKVFDRLYFIGDAFVGTWALVTSDGIIQWDTMDNADEAEHIIEAGYKTLGLDPGKIKYIILTHGHGDHFGGVKYFTQKYPGIKVLASPADWALMAATKPGPRFGDPPARGEDVTDGEKLTLGDTTITLYVTPGHTKGPVSAIVPVTDHGQPHTLAIFGGFGLPAHVAPGPRDAGLDEYDAQVRRFTKIVEAAGVDGIVSTHPGFDGTELNIEKLRTRKQGDPDPWIMGKAGSLRFMQEALEMSAAERALLRHYGEK